MTWREKILRSRNEVELRCGRTPTYVLIREEIWLELADQDYDTVLEIDGMIVCRSAAIRNPFEFAAGIVSEEDENS